MSIMSNGADRYFLVVDEITGRERHHGDQPSFVPYLEVWVDREREKWNRQ